MTEEDWDELIAAWRWWDWLGLVCLIGGCIGFYVAFALTA